MLTETQLYGIIMVYDIIFHNPTRVVNNRHLNVIINLKTC